MNWPRWEPGEPVADWEITVIREAARIGDSQREVAAFLGRSHGRVQRIAWALGIRFQRKPGSAAIEIPDLPTALVRPARIPPDRTLSDVRAQLRSC